MNMVLDTRPIEQVGTGDGEARLDRDGYCIARRLVPPELITRIDTDLDREFRETPFCRGDFYGERTKRFGRLLARSSNVARLVMAPAILDCVRSVLEPWCDRIQLNVAQAIEIHPGALAQFPHRDQDMWPDAAGSHEYLVNVIWPLTPFTADNGATRVWPRSHGVHALEEMPLGEPLAAECRPGDALIFLGSTLHAAGANRTASPRRGIVIGYSLGWLKPYENPWLAYPPEVARHFAPDLASLAGYCQHRPNLGNFEGRCPSVLLGDGAGARLAATDALRPEQAQALSQFVERQRLDQIAAGDRAADAW